MKISKIIIIIAIVFVTAAVGLTLGINYYFSLPDERILVTVRSGTSAETIAQILLDNGLILSKKLFLFYSDFTGSTRKLKSGTYSFSQRMLLPKIIGMLRHGKTYSIKVTIPEGFAAVQIAELVGRKKIADKEKLLKLVRKNKLEGYLFPETYFFPLDVGAQEIIDQMTEEFNKRYTQKLENRAADVGLTKRQVITLASIVEKEAKLEEERRLISAVFLNRLKKRWLLESCSTVRYVLGEKKPYNKKLSYADLKIKSPYNTYVHRGLPPGPICNPGLNSIKAVLYPEITDVMFFFSENTQEGSHKFSRYYQDHLKGQKN